MQRREFLGVAAAAAATGGLVSRPVAASRTAGVDEWRRQFPALSQKVNGLPLTYLDSAATTLRPNAVIDAIADFYRTENANPGAALHTLARRASATYEGARRTIAEFVNARDASEIVFTRGTTDGINLVAAAWGGANLRPGDEILIGIAEHSSNMLPWQMIAQKTGATVRYFAVDDSGHPSLDDFQSKLTPKVRVVAFSHVSNVLGMVNPAKEMCARARAANRIVVVDGAQSVPHFPVDMQDIGCDFMAFSSHKMLGPMGVGVLWGRRELLDAMPPYQGGSNMAHDVDVDSLHLSEGALKFGAGTPNVSGPVGLAAAIGFLRGIGADALRQHEKTLAQRFVSNVAGNRRVRLLGSTNPDEKISVFAFTVTGRQPREIVAGLDAKGIAIRAGDLASLPLLKRLGTTVAARASCYLYTTTQEIDQLSAALESI